MQYKTYSSGTTRKFKNGLYEFRRQNRGGKFCIDYNLSSTGFAGTENIDWKNASKSTCPGSLGIYREGIRDNGYVLATILDCIAKRAKILGYEAAQKLALNFEQLSDIQLDQIMEKLLIKD